MRWYQFGISALLMLMFAAAVVVRLFPNIWESAVAIHKSGHTTLLVVCIVAIVLFSGFIVKAARG